MALIVKDRVKQLTTTSGTADFALGATPSGFLPFSGVMAVADTCYYVAASGAEWEVGIGTYSAANVLSRTTVLASSAGGTTKVTFSGTNPKEVWIDATADLLQTQLNRPWFSANKGNTAQSIPSATDTKVTFTTESADNGGIYDNANSQIVATRTCQVLVGVRTLITAGMVDATVSYIMFRKNGTIISRDYLASSGTGSHTLRNVDVIPLVTGDTVDVTMFGAGTGAKTMNGDPINTEFWGMLL